MKIRRSVLLGVGALSSCALVLTGCGGATRGSAEPSVSPVVVVAAPAAATTATTCNDANPTDASLAPGGITTDPATWPGGSTMAAIKKRGYLRVATSGDVLLWGATDTKTGNPEGYDVDLAARIATALGVNPAKTVYDVIPYSKRQTALGDNKVDLVAQQMTITCARWTGTPVKGTTPAAPAINLSIPYYIAGAEFLVHKSSGITGIDDLKGETVCGTVGSTSLQAVAGVAGVKTVTAPSAGQCLVKFQEGDATVVVGDQTTLAGFTTQDPSSQVVGKPLFPGSYGLGTQAGQTDFTQFVNAVLTNLRDDGTLTELYDKWMKPHVLKESQPNLAAPVYGRNIKNLKRQS